MNTTMTSRTLARRRTTARQDLDDEHRELAWSEALHQLYAARVLAHVQYIGTDYDDDLRYVVVLGEN